MKYKSGSGQSGKRWKVRAQFKWCADQNYGFEVWSKGLPACNQRCDNRWAHRKCLIMSIIIMNGCATTTSMCQRTRCRRKKNEPEQRGERKRKRKKNIETRAQFTVINTKQKAVSRTYRFDCVPVFHRYFSLFLYRCPSVQCQRWLCVFSTSSFRSFGMAKRLVCSYLLVWLLLLSFFFLFHKMWVNKNLLISFIMRMLLSRRWPLIAGCSFYSSHSLTHSAHVHMPLSSELEIFVQVLFISRLHVPAIVAVVLVGIVAGRVCECVCRLFSLCSFNTLVC